MLGIEPCPIDLASLLPLFCYQDLLTLILFMKSCHTGLVFLVKCVSHVILKSISDVFGSQIAQFCFLSFVDSIVFLEEWIKVAWSHSHYFAFWLAGREPPSPGWQLWECALLNNSVVNHKFAYLFSFCVCLNACHVPETVHCAFGEIKMNKGDSWHHGADSPEKGLQSLQDYA